MRRTLSWFLILFLFAGPMSPAGSAGPSYPTTLVVYPLRDGIEDEASQKTAVWLRRELQNKPKLKIISPENVESVLQYYKGYSFASQETLAAQARDFLNRAKEHYYQMDYTVVRAELDQVFAIFKSKPELLFTDGLILFDGWVTLGLTEAAQKKTRQAVVAFGQAFRIHPFYPIETGAFSPSVRNLLSQAKENLFKEQTGRLEVAGLPKVADIFLNGIYQGVSPKTLVLPAGEYALSFKANNYRGLRQHLVIRPGQTASLQHKLYWKGPAEQKQPQADAIAEGLRIAELLKVDKVLLVNVDEKNIQAQMTDRQYRAGHQSIVLPNQAGQPEFQDNLEKLTRFIYAQSQLALLKNPQAHLDPDGIGDPILLGGRRRKISKGLLYGGLGGLSVVGILAGVLAAGGGGARTGTVSVSFK